MCSDGMQKQFLLIYLVVRDELGQHLARCVVQPLNHAVGLCVGAAGGSLHGPKHAGNIFRQTVDTNSGSLSLRKV